MRTMILFLAVTCQVFSEGEDPLRDLPPRVHATPIQVTEFGASPTLPDNTSAFQAALDEAARRGGEIVEVPPGCFRFRGHLEIRGGAALVGRYRYSPSHPRDAATSVTGTTFEVFADRGQPGAQAFLTVGENSSLQGLSIRYPEQDPQAPRPVEYPFCVAMRGNNPAVQDMELLNPYQGIDASFNQRALIRNVHGQPLKTGLFVDQIYDIGRIENVHWNPWWSIHTPIYQWQREHGEAFVFGRTDWHSVLNTFCYGYHVGFRFLRTREGTCNGSFVGIGADGCHTCVQVDEASPFGLLITNGQFVAFEGEDPTHVRVGEANSGLVRFSNCSFWGAARRCGYLQGTGTVQFADCSFMNWSEDMPCLEARGGSLTVRGCEFQGEGAHFRLTAHVRRAILTENLLSHPLRLQNSARGTVIERDNLGP